MKIISNKGTVNIIPNEILKNGNRDYDWVAVEDEIYLELKWEVYGGRNIFAFDSRPDKIEENTEVNYYSHEPTEEELIYFMKDNGLNQDDYVFVNKCFKLSRHYND